jgi:hypothetical protein
MIRSRICLLHIVPALFRYWKLLCCLTLILCLWHYRNSLGRFRVDPHLEKLPDWFDPAQNAVVYESERRIALPQSGTVLSGVGCVSTGLSTSALQASRGETLGIRSSSWL